MKQSIIAYLCGGLFAIGLGISGMTQPGKIIAFLDFAGHWDPTLLFVMMGAVLVYAVGYRLVIGRQKPLVAESFSIPTLKTIDRPLLIGSALFGIGWGLSGYCPGPSFTAVVSLRPEPLIFVASLAAGILLFQWKARRRS